METRLEQPGFPIVEARFLATDVKRFRVLAPRVARHYQAGQFVIVRVHPRGERIPLTVADVDRDAGTITLIVKSLGKTTRLLNRLEGPRARRAEGDRILDVVGPLGNPTRIARVGTVVVVGGGVGAAIAYPVARAMRAADNRVVFVLGARTCQALLLEDELRAAVDRLVVVTEDGSAGARGLVTDALANIVAHERVDEVFAVGPIPMMRAISELTRPHAIPTQVSLNALMVDGTGMCGGCRVRVGGDSRFACVDGPDFDAHAVDFELLALRNAQYEPQERASLLAFLDHPDAEVEGLRDDCRLSARHPELREEETR